MEAQSFFTNYFLESFSQLLESNGRAFHRADA